MSNKNEKYYLPKSLDEPFRLYLLTIDELIILALPIAIIGLLFGEVMIGAFLGVIGVFLIKKFKGEQGHFYLLHLTYWHLPNFGKFKITPPSYIRKYLG